MAAKILLGWQINNISGWGILGLNLFFQWAVRTDIAPLMWEEIKNEYLLYVDPLRLSAVSRAITASNNFVDAAVKTAKPQVDFDGTVIHPINHSDRPIPVFGTRNVG